jgi:hypothetical protein
MLTEVQTRARLAVTATFITNGLVVGAFVARIPDIKNTLEISNSTLFFRNHEAFSIILTAQSNSQDMQ